jgi:hypothetical protein
MKKVRVTNRVEKEATALKNPLKDYLKDAKTSRKVKYNFEKEK